MAAFDGRTDVLAAYGCPIYMHSRSKGNNDRLKVAQAHSLRFDELFWNFQAMAQIESISKMAAVPLTLHAVEKKGVARLLKENPYMGGVAMVGCQHNVSLVRRFTQY
jgi:hypothetical protein